MRFHLSQIAVDADNNDRGTRYEDNHRDRIRPDRIYHDQNHYGHTHFTHVLDASSLELEPPQ